MGAGAEPPPGIATGPHPSSGFAGTADAVGAAWAAAPGAVWGVEEAETAGVSGETAWNSEGAGPAGAARGSGEVTESRPPGSGAARCPAGSVR